MTQKTYKIVAYDQPGASFYAAAMPAVDLIGRVEIRRRSQDDVTGVQRDEDDKRVSAIARYLEGKDPILPTPIVISCSSERVRVQQSEIVIDDAVNSIGHVLDGQHRILGLAQIPRQKLQDFSLLVVFVFDIDAYSDASVFVTINANQRQVSKSLIYDLFGLNPNPSLEKTCHEIVRSLNEDSESPFHKRIKLLGKKAEDTETLSQAAFIDHLIVAIRSADSPLDGLLRSEGDWTIRKVINNNFRAVASALNQVPNYFPPDYFLKTSGYGGVMKAMPQLVRRGQIKRSLQEDFFKEVYVRFLNNNDHPPEGTGNSAMIAIRERVLAALEE